MNDPTFIAVWNTLTKDEKRRIASHMKISVSTLALHRIEPVLRELIPLTGTSCGCKQCEVGFKLQKLTDKRRVR